MYGRGNPENVWRKDYGDGTTFEKNDRSSFIFLHLC